MVLHRKEGGAGIGPHPSSKVTTRLMEVGNGCDLYVTGFYSNIVP